MADPAAWNTVIRRWRKLDKKGAGIGFFAILFFQEFAKKAVALITPSPVGTIVGYFVVGAALLLWYLFREVPIDDAKDIAKDATDEAKDKAKSTVDHTPDE